MTDPRVRELEWQLGEIEKNLKRAARLKIAYEITIGVLLALLVLAWWPS